MSRVTLNFNLSKIPFVHFLARVKGLPKDRRTPQNAARRRRTPQDTAGRAAERRRTLQKPQNAAGRHWTCRRTPLDVPQNPTTRSPAVARDGRPYCPSCKTNPNPNAVFWTAGAQNG